MAKKKTVTRKKVSPLKGRKHKKWGVVPKHNRRVAGKTLGNATVSSLKSEMKNRLKESLGKDLVKRELATTKTERKKLTKKIRLTKSELTRLNK